jgi:hypothetical protein
MLKKVLNYFSKDKNPLGLILIFLGTTSWSLVMVRNGLVYGRGVYFWGPNAHDGLWHIALIKSLANFNLNNPVFNGEAIKNYHIGFDFLLAMIYKITTISPFYLYFQILPPIIALSCGVLVYKLVHRIWDSARVGNLVLFLVYFGGSLGWIVSLIRYQEWGGESMFWSMQANSTLLNPPFALSLILILVLLNYLVSRFKLTALQVLYVSSLLTIIFIIKAYAGVLMSASFLIVGLLRLYKEKSWDYLKIFALATVSIATVSYLIKIESQRLFEVYPFWFLESMMLLPDRLNWVSFFQAISAYKTQHIYWKWMAAICVAGVIFLLGNLSLRILGVWQILKIKNEKSQNVLLLMWVAIFTGLAIPVFLVQKGTPWNTIQFFYYSVFFLAIFAGKTLADIAKWLNAKLLYGFYLTVFVFIIPTSLITMRTYISPEPATYIAKDELSALNFLANEPEGVVLYAAPTDLKQYRYQDEITPIYAYASTSYFSAFTGKPVYFADEINLNIMNYDYVRRKLAIEKVLDSPNSDFTFQFLGSNNISYIYVLKNYSKGFDENVLNLENIFDNDAIIIYRVL